ncbi:MAG: type 2 lantipeptide synthetase LanM [Kutzneria sp.]|nr:type 2 lantipeptide synthetase LanM [Kutzneria sp.]
MITSPEMWSLVPFWPLLCAAAELMRQQCRPLNDAVAPDTVSETIVSGYLASMSSTLKTIAARSVAHSLDANAAGSPSSAGDHVDADERACASLTLQYGHRVAAVGFMERYPALVRQVTHLLANCVSTLGLMIERLLADRRLLAQLGISDSAELIGVKALGDLHQHGAVLALEFDDDAAVVYKPRGMALEVQLAKLLDWLEESDFGVAPRVPPSLDRGSYGWQAFVRWQESDSDHSVASFYRRMGGLVAVAYVLRATDLHFENIICDGQAPVIVDPECAFSASDWATVSDRNEPEDPYKGTVLHSGILPNSIDRDAKNGRVDYSILGCFGDRQPPKMRRTLGFDDTGAAYFSFSEVPASLPEHLPGRHGASVPTAGYESHLLDGFTSVYKRFLTTQELLNDDSGPLAGFASCRVRHLFRGTSFYGKILWELGHPDAAQCGMKQDEVINTLWPLDSDDRPAAVGVFQAERHALLTGCIPSFEGAASGVDLVAGRQRIDGVFTRSGFELVKQRIADLSTEDLALQREIIRVTLGIPFIPPNARATTSYAPVEVDAPVDRSDVLDMARSIRDALDCSAIRRHSPGVWWLTTNGHDGKWYSVVPNTSAKFYDGLAGIALFAGYFDLVAGERSRFADELERAMVAEVERALDRFSVPTLARQRRLGAFDGLWGSVYVAACLGASKGDHRLLAWARDMAAQLDQGTEHMPGWDVIDGASGVAALTSALALRVGGDTFERAARNALETTADRLEPVLRHEQIPAGMAHGLSGPALAFQRGAVLFPHTDSRAAVAVVLEAERSQCYWDERGWKDVLLDDADNPDTQRGKNESWCRGAVGIGLSRAAIAELIRGQGDGNVSKSELRLLADEIELATRVTRPRGFGRNHCLCHGAMGAVELFRAVGTNPGSADMSTRLFTGAVTAGRTTGWLTGFPGDLPSPGLMAGMAGIGYGLLRYLEPDSVPNLLILDAPVRTGMPPMSDKGRAT